jgi:hypothetical protein
MLSQASVGRGLGEHAAAGSAEFSPGHFGSGKSRSCENARMTTASSLPCLAATSASYQLCGVPGLRLSPLPVSSMTASRASSRRKPSLQPPSNMSGSSASIIIHRHRRLGALAQTGDALERRLEVGLALDDVAVAAEQLAGLVRGVEVARDRHPGALGDVAHGWDVVAGVVLAGPPKSPQPGIVQPMHM